MNKLEEGINSYLIGDVNSAIKLLKAYLDGRENPPSGQAYYYLGLAHTDIGKNNEAGNYFAKALEIEPDKGLYHYELAQVYAKLMLFNQAIPHLLKTVEQNPEHVRAHFILGQIYFKNGDLDAASKQFKIVTEISPSYADGFYELGNSLYYKGDEKGAKDAYLTACKLNSSLAGAYIKLGQLYADEKNYDEATKYFQQVYELGIHEPAFMSHYILTLAANGQKEKASVILAALEDIYPTSPELIKLKEIL